MKKLLIIYIVNILFIPYLILSQPIFNDSLNAGLINNSNTFSLNDKMITYKPGNSKDIDTVIKYSSKKMVKMYLKNKIMNLEGDAKIDYVRQKIESEKIVINFEKSEMISLGIKDSSNKITGFPKFTDNGETYVGEKIIYNFKTKQGTITLGETELSEGYYFGEKIKRVSEDELFVKEGRYTTCDAPHPHYYFGSPKMKVKAKDKVFLDPIIFYVEDMPIFIIPFGLYFPNKSGRQSGLMIPSFFFSNFRGVVLQDLGYYFALSDYYDTQFKIDFFSKGGFTFKNQTRWKLLDVFDGNLDLEYGKTRLSPKSDYTTNYNLSLRHNHTINPQTRIDANVSFRSQDFNRNTEFTNYNERLQQNISSRASFSKSFDNGSSISIAFNREQDIITDENRTTFPSISLTLPQIQPLKFFTKPDSWIPQWLRDLRFSYSGTGTYYAENVLDRASNDSNFVHNFRSSISHNPSISISPKFGYFNVTPFINFKANNYFRRSTKFYDLEDSTIKTEYEKGFFTEYNYSLGTNVSTRLFGIFEPDLFNIKAFRHTFQPTIGYSYTPDLSANNNDFYGKYFNPNDSQWVEYSRFESDGGGFASKRITQIINYSILNSFEAKIFQGDTLEDKNIELLRWNISGNYDLTKDSLKFSDIAMDMKIPTLNALNLNTRAIFTLYDDAPTYDKTNATYSGPRTYINKFLILNGKGLMRLKSFSIDLAFNFSNDGFQTNESFGNDNITQKESTDSTDEGLGSRFKQRYEYSETSFDFWGVSSPGYQPLNIPWSISISMGFDYNEIYTGQINRKFDMNARLNFDLTQTWHFTVNANYDITNNDLTSGTISIIKDLHCWQLSFNWWPIGFNSGFYLNFGIKAPSLRDLKIEKRDNPLLR